MAADKMLPVQPGGLEPQNPWGKKNQLVMPTCKAGKGSVETEASLELTGQAA